MKKSPRNISQPERALQQPMPPARGKSSSNGNAPKKPVWKRWWFWLIVVILVIGVAASGSNGSGDSKNATTLADGQSESLDWKSAAKACDEATKTHLFPGQSYVSQTNKKLVDNVSETSAFVGYHADIDGVTYMIQCRVMGNKTNQQVTDASAKALGDNPDERKWNAEDEKQANESPQAEPSATYGQWSVTTPGTNEALTEICHKAKADLAGATDEQIEQSKQFVIAHIDNPTADQATMEGLIYHGYFLEHGAKDENLRNAGMDALQAVKYQYRGHVSETEQNATQENIRQVKEALGLQ